MSETESDVTVSQTDRDVLRRLADRLMEIAGDPAHDRKAQLWRRMNDLEPDRPMVWINEVPWHEMDVDGELQPIAEDDFCRGVEMGLRRTIYQWDHMPADMIIDGIIYSPLAYRDTGFGMHEDARVVKTDETSNIISREYRPQIDSEEDIEKIRMPQIERDDEAGRRRYELLCDIVGDIVPVQQRGVPGLWFAPWDALVTWWGVQKALMDLALRPELVHKAMDRLVDAHLRRLDQLETQGLLSRNDKNIRIGSGGYGYTNDLPQPDFDANHVRTQDLWGCATAQIFDSVSPKMHEEFALQYERRWLERFGLTYYGCCEPLDNKIDILHSAANLRKISISPWADPENAAGQMRDQYVISYKPNPAIFAEDTWKPERARKQLRETLEKMEGCAIEIIMKDISTVRYDPQRLWEWAHIAVEEAERST